VVRDRDDITTRNIYCVAVCIVCCEKFGQQVSIWRIKVVGRIDEDRAAVKSGERWVATVQMRRLFCGTGAPRSVHPPLSCALTTLGRFSTTPERFRNIHELDTRYARLAIDQLHVHCIQGGSPGSVPPAKRLWRAANDSIPLELAQLARPS